MGATNFGMIEIGKFKTVQEAYRSAVKKAQLEYGTDPYNGTISTTNGVRLATGNPAYGTNDFEAFESKRLDSIQKWGACEAVEITGPKLSELKEASGLSDEKGIRAFYFFGWAAE